jgi:hypothetical protein
MNEQEKKSGLQKGPLVVKLSEPLIFGSEVIESLTLQKPKAKHIKNVEFKNAKLADILQVASKLSGVSVSYLDELSIEDAKRVADAVGELL